MLVKEWNGIVTQIANLARVFIEESSYNLTYSEENTTRTLYQFINHPNVAILAVLRENEVAGFSILSRDNEFHNEYFGYLIKFYVSPKHRGKGVGRELMQETVDWFDSTDCINSFATASANIGQDQLFRNLLKKFGYSQDGEQLIREKNVKI